MPDHIEISESKSGNELPFTYQRVNDPDKADYKKYRKNRIVWEGEEPEKYTDEQIIESVKHEKEFEEWYTSPYWRAKGLPYEQVDLRIGEERKITMYNYDDENELTEEHLESAKRIIEKLSGSFPQVLDIVKNILINDKQDPSIFGDQVKYPLSGLTELGWKIFKMMPNGMSFKEYRVPGVKHFEGVFMHELTHLLEKDLIKIWKENFTWLSWKDAPEDYEMRRSPDGSNMYPFNKTTGEMLGKYEFPLEADQCLNYYAKLNWQEDSCESMVAYFYNPELLKRISPKKFEILESLDKKSKTHKVNYKRVPGENISLPHIEPQTVTYYIEEEKDYPFRVINRRDTNTSK